MSVFAVPLSPDQAHYVQRTALDGVSYVLDLRWNARAAAWYISIGRDDGTPILTSLRASVLVPLDGNSIDPALPPGLLIALDQTRKDLEAGRYDLGDRVRLTYYDQSELA